MRDQQSIALYIHFPWCASLCTYCDFDRQASGFSLIPAYLEAVPREMAWYPQQSVHSVFFGGGTPSLMSPAQLDALLAAAREHFALSSDVEVTVECNPSDLTREKVKGYLEAGANRLSLGVQSLYDHHLRVLGRRHTADQAVAAYLVAREAGAGNINVDLMYGLPGQTIEEWGRVLERVVDLGPDHLSCYLLTLEAKVPLGRAVERGVLRLPDDDLVADMYLLTQEYLSAHGYIQYEVSNWARPGQECRHNLTYWRSQEYVGLGPGGSSYWRGQRYKNTPSVRQYLEAIKRGRPAYVENYQPDLAEAMSDFLVLGLRLTEGLDTNEFQRRFGLAVQTVLGDELEQLIAAGALRWDDGRLSVPSTRFLVSNSVFVRVHSRIRSFVTQHKLL